MRAAIFYLSAATLFAQEPGTIRGVVRDALTNTPLSDVSVRAGRISVRTDAQGGFTFRNVPPGEVQIDASGETAKSFAPKKVTLAAGQEVTVDLLVQALGRISGAVMDADGKPVSDALITAVTREYSLGDIRYGLWYSTLTNARGEFGPSSLLAMRPARRSRFVTQVPPRPPPLWARDSPSNPVLGICCW